MDILGMSSLKLVLKKFFLKIFYVLPLIIFFQFLKRHLTAQRKVPMLKHEHIRNQNRQNSRKKQKKYFQKKFHALPLYDTFSLSLKKWTIFINFGLISKIELFKNSKKFSSSFKKIGWRGPQKQTSPKADQHSGAKYFLFKSRAMFYTRKTLSP